MLCSAGKGRFPGIIDLFGSGGGLCEYRASLLAGHGFAVLALAYFRFEDLPEYLSDVHLEYFEEALAFLLQHPKVGSSAVLNTKEGREVDSRPEPKALSGRWALEIRRESQAVPQQWLRLFLFLPIFPLS